MTLDPATRVGQRLFHFVGLASGPRPHLHHQVRTLKGSGRDKPPRWYIKLIVFFLRYRGFNSHDRCFSRSVCG